MRRPDCRRNRPSSARTQRWSRKFAVGATVFVWRLHQFIGFAHRVAVVFSLTRRVIAVVSTGWYAHRAPCSDSRLEAARSIGGSFLSSLSTQRGGLRGRECDRSALPSSTGNAFPTRISEHQCCVKIMPHPCTPVPQVQWTRDFYPGLVRRIHAHLTVYRASPDFSPSFYVKWTRDVYPGHYFHLSPACTCRCLFRMKSTRKRDFWGDHFSEVCVFDVCRAHQGDERRRQNQQLLHEQLLKQNWDLREAHEKSLNEMEELKRLQGSAFDTIARIKLVEDQGTILELTGKIQELQNEINCMNDSRDFQDAESVCSGHSHIASQPVSFPPHSVLGGMLSRSIGMTSRRDGPPSIWDTHGVSGKRFCKSSRVLISTLSAGIESIITGENQTPVQDQRCQSGPSAKNSIVFSGGDSSKN